MELIDSVIKKFNVSESQFERFFGLAKGAIKNVRYGTRPLASKYWHLFYDPQYERTLRRDRAKTEVTKLVSESVSELTPNKANKSKSDTKQDSKIQKLLSK
jgi:hypothetical protein